LVLPVLAGATALPLPPRPTEEPPVVVVIEKEPSPTRITLSLDLTSEAVGKGVDPRALWTVVQWQDALGDWHDVEGWVGPLDTIDATRGEKSWGLCAGILGRAPPLAGVYEAGWHAGCGTETFALPASSGKT
jgi:hypothetical protein